MIKAGITGGIGSGKSLICKVFSQMGIPVYFADYEAKQLVKTHPEIRSGLIQLLGEAIYLPSGEIDREKMAATIFKDKELIARVNSIIHPRVREHYEQWLLKYPNEPYTLHEAAITFETGLYKTMDYMILVTAPEIVRIQRVAQRDNASKEDILSRMRNQWPDEQKIPLADFIIENDDQHLVLPKIIETDKQLKKYGKIR